MSSTSQWLTEALATRDLEKVVPNMGAAGERINDARRHIRSARVLAGDDATLAIAACHDAIRKSVTAHMAAKGFRPRAGEGAHRIVLQYARHQLSDVVTPQDLVDAEDIRKDRAVAEYGDFASRKLGPEHVLWAADVAELFVNAVASKLSSQSRGRRGSPT
jgi:hypothetical protein